MNARKLPASRTNPPRPTAQARAATDASLRTPARAPCIALLSEVFDMRVLAPAFLALRPDVQLCYAEDFERDPALLAEIDAAACWHPQPGLLARMPALRLIQSVGAGIDHLLRDPTLPTDVMMCRIVDPDMQAGMVAYVCWAVTHRQRNMDRYLQSSMAGQWQEQPVVSPVRHEVGILGAGVLGRACAGALASIGYPVRTWSRSRKGGLPPGVRSYAGEAELTAFLAGCATLVCLLPLTDETRDRLDAKLFAALPRGAHLVNVGRGEHLVDADLLAALASGQLAFATLDAFRQEPLPSDHPLRGDPRIVITPHSATRTDPATLARQTLENLAAILQGRPPHATVEAEKGY